MHSLHLGIHNRWVIGVLLALLCVSTIVTAQPQESPNYHLNKSVLDAGGLSSASPNYQLTSSIGQSTPLGAQSSPNYQLYAGFMSSFNTTTIRGRCCYNSGSACADVTETQCATLGGLWNPNETCASSACQVAPDSCWSRTYGGSELDGALGIIEIADCGFIMAGYHISPDRYQKGQIIRTTLTGDTVWSRLYGGSNFDLLYKVVQLADTDFVAVGYTFSSGTDSYDGWLVNFNLNGDTLWTLTVGGAGYDFFLDAVRAPDGSIWATGYTTSSGAGQEDVWIAHVSAGGTLLGSRTFGGAGTDRSWGISADANGYVVAAENGSAGGSSWLIKLNQNGDSLWSHTYSGTSGYTGYCEPTLNHDGYFVAGGSGGDFWLARADLAGNPIWQHTYGGLSDELLTYEFLQDSSGILLGGYTYSYGSGGADYWVVRTDLNGSPLWSKSLGGPGNDLCFARTRTSDGGYALLGRTNSFGAGDYDWWLVKLGNCNQVPLQSPQVVIRSVGADNVLNWSRVTYNTNGCLMFANSYDVYSASRPDTAFQFLASTSDTSYVHSGVVGNRAKLFYHVTAVNTPTTAVTAIERRKDTDKPAQRSLSRHLQVCE